jgi:preprotein translocase subunit SecG
MQEILLVIHLIVAVALVGLILIQRSEGGALGIGGGGFMSARGSANLLTRATAILAVAFVGLSLALSILASQANRNTSVFDDPAVIASEEEMPEEPLLPEGN